MGACTSKPQVLENAGEAPLPLPPKEETEVINEEVNKKDEAPGAEVDGDEAKRQSLGDHLFKNEDKKGSSENNASEKVVKQEDATEEKPQESPETVVDVIKTETTAATDGLKSENAEENKSEAEASEEKKTEEKPVETTNPETSDKSKPEKVEEKSSEEKKADEKTEAETTEAKKTEEKKAAPDEKKPLFKLWF